MNIFRSLRETVGLEIDFEIGISIPCFPRLPQQVSLRPLHCDVECFDCKSDVYFQSWHTVNVPRSYRRLS